MPRDLNKKSPQNHQYKSSNMNSVSLLMLLAANAFVIGIFVNFKTCPVAKAPMPNESGSDSVNSMALLRGETVTAKTDTATIPSTATGMSTSERIGQKATDLTINTGPIDTVPVIQPKEKKLLKLDPCPRLGNSQGNQDCLIDKIFDAIGTTNKYYVEYGFNTNEQCSFSGPNTCRLWKEHNWTGLLLDGSHENPAINLHAHYLYSNNMVSLLDKYHVPKETDFLSGDMDSHDYFILKAILDSGKYRPRVISTEYNQNYPLSWEISQIDPTINQPDIEPPPYLFQNCTWGASPSAFRYLLEHKYGYKMVAVTPILDLFWIRGDILDELNLDVPSYESLMAGKVPLPCHPGKSNPFCLKNLVDVKVYEETKSVRLSNRAAVQTILKHVQSTTEPTIPCLGRLTPAQLEEYLWEHPPIGKHFV